MSFDALALEAAYKIEDLYAKPYIGGIAQRRAAIQCLIRDYLEKVETIRWSPPVKYVSDKEALHLIDAHDDALSAAEMILAAISALSDYDMADGDGARKLADAWLEKFKKT